MYMYILIRVSSFFFLFLFFWPYSYQTNEVTNLHAIAAEDERGRNLYSCETRESDESDRYRKTDDSLQRKRILSRID